MLRELARALRDRFVMVSTRGYDSASGCCTNQGSIHNHERSQAAVTSATAPRARYRAQMGPGTSEREPEGSNHPCRPISAAESPTPARKMNRGDPSESYQKKGLAKNARPQKKAQARKAQITQGRKAQITYISSSADHAATPDPT